MKAHDAAWAALVLVMAASGSSAQDRSYLPLAEATQVPALLTAQPKDQSGKEPKEKDQPPATDVFAQAPTTGGEAPSGINPRMIGDFPGYFSLRTITVPSFQTVTQFRTVAIETPGGIVQNVEVFNSTRVPVNVTTVTRVLSPGHGAFKVAENQSPAPQDRAYFTYNYYNGVRGSDTGLPGPRVVTQQSAVNPDSGQFTITSTEIPGGSAPRLNLHQETFGFEKAFLDGTASIGLRVPLFQQQGDGSFSQNDFGDLSVFLKYAFYRDRTTGNVLCGGLAITAPTGPAFDTLAGTFHSTLLQPYGGGIWNAGRFYVLGFSSLIVPTDSRDVTTWFNDLGVGYWLFRGDERPYWPAVIPTVEVHVATPLNHRSPTDPVSCPDILTLTTGCHFGLTNRTMLTIGVATPLTGPQPFDVEAIVQFNFRF